MQNSEYYCGLLDQLNENFAQKKSFFIKCFDDGCMIQSTNSLNIHRIHQIWLLARTTSSASQNNQFEFHRMKQLFQWGNGILQGFQNYRDGIKLQQSHLNEFREIILNKKLISFKSSHSFLLSVLFLESVHLKKMLQNSLYVLTIKNLAFQNTGRIDSIIVK